MLLSLDSFDRDLFQHDIRHGAASFSIGQLLADGNLRELLHDIHPVHDLSKNGVAVVEVRLRPERDEELASVRIRLSGVGHRYAAFPVEFQLGRYLVAQPVTGPAVSAAASIAGLNHEAVDDAMECNSVVERFPVYRFARFR